MDGKVIVAWATPIDTALVGAQLEAYNETKEIIAIFQRCVQSALTDSALAQLPPDLIKIVANYVQSSIFGDKFAWWDRLLECCLDICGPIDYFDPDETQSLRKEHLQSLESPPDYDMEYNDSDSGGYLEENHDAVKMHKSNVETLFSKVAYYFSPMCDTQLARSRKVFSDDLGLEIHFSVIQKAGNGRVQRCSTDQSYLFSDYNTINLLAH